MRNESYVPICPDCGYELHTAMVTRTQHGIHELVLVGDVWAAEAEPRTTHNEEEIVRCPRCERILTRIPLKGDPSFEDPMWVLKMRVNQPKYYNPDRKGENEPL